MSMHPLFEGSLRWWSVSRLWCADIDQIGAAQPRLCWDPSHGHPLGGGAHWVAGYKSLLANARAQAGNNAMLVTESNAEPYMGSLDSYLTLVAFGGDFAGPGAFVPAFASIYGVRDSCPLSD
jgi:hypothetical protein